MPEQQSIKHLFVSAGARTERGGVVQKVSGQMTVSAQLGQAAMVGDQVHYADGSTATIVSGVVMKDRPSDTAYAIVGSQLSNGDVITDSPERTDALSPDVFALSCMTQVRA